MVIWIIGKSGSGKSYLGKFLENKLKKKFKKVYWFIGQMVINLEKNIEKIQATP